MTSTSQDSYAILALSVQKIMSVRVSINLEGSCKILGIKG